MGLRLFITHLNHGFLVLKNVEHRTKSRKFRVRRKHNQHHSTQDCHAWLGLQFGFGCACFDVVSRNEFPRAWSLVSFDWIGEE